MRCIVCVWFHLFFYRWVGRGFCQDQFLNLRCVPRRNRFGNLTRSPGGVVGAFAIVQAHGCDVFFWLYPVVAGLW